MKKVFVLLFPQKEYLDDCHNDECGIAFFNACIKKRYLDNGYDFVVASYKNSNLGFITEKPNKVVEADITFQQSSPYFAGDEWRYADFKKLANDLEIREFDKVVIGGFHCYSCVEMLANEIYKINKNTLIDSDLTEMLWSIARFTENWEPHTFNPDLKIERVFKFTPPDILKRNKEKFSNPVWGISTEMLNKIDSQIEKLEIEE